MADFTPEEEAVLLKNLGKAYGKTPASPIPLGGTPGLVPTVGPAGPMISELPPGGETFGPPAVSMPPPAPPIAGAATGLPGDAAGGYVDMGIPKPPPGIGIPIQKKKPVGVTGEVELSGTPGIKTTVDSLLADAVSKEKLGLLGGLEAKAAGVPPTSGPVDTGSLPPQKQPNVSGGSGFGMALKKEGYVSPGEKAMAAAIRAGMSAELGGQQKLLEQKATDEAIRSEFLSGMHDELEARRKDADAKEAGRQAWVTATLNKQDSFADDLNKMQIDPKRHWNSMSTFSQIMTGIAVVLGGAANAKGMENLQLKQLNDAVDKDIAQQKFAIDKGFATLAAKRGIFADRLKAFGDERLAETSSKISYLESIKVKMEEMAASSTSESATIAAGSMGQKLQAEIDKNYAQLMMLDEQRYNAALLAQQQAAAAAAAARKKQDEEIFKASLGLVSEAGKKLASEKGYDLGINVMKTGPLAGQPILVDKATGKPIPQKDMDAIMGSISASKDGVPVPIFTGGPNASGELIPGATVIAPSKEGAKVITDTNKSALNLYKVYDDIEKFIEKNGKTGLKTELAGEAAALEARLKSAYGLFHAHVSDKDMAVSSGLFPEVGSWFDSYNNGKIKIGKQVVLDELGNTYKAILPGAASGVLPTVKAE